jgi:membrane protease YdiL (CAAX protease family)
MKKNLKMIGCILIYIAMYYIILRISVYPIVSLVKHSPSFKAWASNNTSIVVIVNDVLGLIAFVPLVALLKKQSLIKRCNFSKINITAGIIIALMGLASGIFTASIFKLPALAEKFTDINTLLELIGNRSTLPIFLLFVIIGSIYKEVLYRGLIFNELKDNMPVSLAILIQGLIYGLLFFNLNIPMTVYGLLGAIIFALLYIWYGSMWAPIIAQIGSTGGIFVLSKFTGKYTNTGLIFIICISLVITLAGIYVLCVYKNKLSNKALVNINNSLNS